MRLTRYTDYSLRTLIYLGLHEPQKSSIAEIARAYGISESHLIKVVHQLGRSGFIRTSPRSWRWLASWQACRRDHCRLCGS